MYPKPIFFYSPQITAKNQGRKGARKTNNRSPQDTHRPTIKRRENNHEKKSKKIKKNSLVNPKISIGKPKKHKFTKSLKSSQ